MIFLQIPSPSVASFHIGPLTIHFYALCLIAGMAVAGWIAQRRFVARGGNPDKFQNIILVAIVFGIVGARAYHVVTDHQLYFGSGRNPLDALKIWNGGLGIMGGVALGALGAWLMARHYKINFTALADCIAPTMLIGQGIGRLGNWFNQELFGRPTELPWGLQIDRAHRPDGYEEYATFHPTFLYEMIWNFTGAAVLIWAERKFKIGHGRLCMLYIAWYTFGRFFIEALRIDPANELAGFRVNNYTSLILFIASVAGFVAMSKARPGAEEMPFSASEEKAVEQIR